MRLGHRQQVSSAPPLAVARIEVSGDCLVMNEGVPEGHNDVIYGRFLDASFTSAILAEVAADCFL